jgi:hypothetical protein
MDTLGDAEELDDDAGYSDEPAPRGPVMSIRTTESLAVASLVLSACAFLAGGMYQYLAFVIPFSDQKYQYLPFAAPTATLSALAVALGLTAGRRETVDRWVAGSAGAGVIVGGVGFIITVVGFVLVVALGDTSAPAL